MESRRQSTTSGGAESEQGRRVQLDDALVLMASRYRRRLLVALTDHNPQDDGDTQLPVDVTHEDEELERLRTDMTHVHLPKLEAAGVIEWDRDANEISKGPHFEELRPLVELMENHADELPDGWL
jgi:hypothetical protein